MVLTISSSAISASGEVNKRSVNPEPGPVAPVCTKDQIGRVGGSRRTTTACCAVAATCRGRVYWVAQIRSAILQNSDVGIGRCTRKRHRHDVRSCPCRNNVLGVVDRLGCNGSLNGWTHRQRIRVTTSVSDSRYCGGAVIPSDYHNIQIARSLCGGERHADSRLRHLRRRIIALDVGNRRASAVGKAISEASALAVQSYGHSNGSRSTCRCCGRYSGAVCDDYV